MPERGQADVSIVSDAPQFSRTSGVFTGVFPLTLTSTPGARIFYTVDGTEPTQGSQEYRAPISINRSIEVRARAYESGLGPSPVVSQVFLALDKTLSGFSSNLPIVLIDTWGQVIPGTDSDRYAEARAVFVDTGSTGRAAITGEIDFAGRVGLRVRGRSSTQFPKKQYRLETWDDAKEDQDVSLFGLPSESDWVLSNPYSDKTLMRNYLAYRWWEVLGHYSVRTRFCEVFLNEDRDATMSYADDYVGVYLLTESIKIGPDRLDLADLTPQDNAEPNITGGYVVEMGNANPGGFASTISGQTVEFSWWDPEVGQLTGTQRQWVRDYIADFEGSLYGEHFDDPNQGYAAFTDVGSQVDYDLVRELTRNFDGGSTFFHIDRGGRLTMGPLWDYDMALGNVNYAHNDEPGYSTTGWNDSYMAPGVNGWCPWWYRFRADPDYRQRRIDRWFELRRGPFSDAALLADVETARALLASEAAARNFARRPVLGQYVWANPPGWADRRTYANEVDWMRQWLQDRAAWIDAQFMRPPQISPAGGPVPSGTVVTLVSGSGEVYYTLDGTDPRIWSPAGGRASGDVSPSAVRYSPGSPIVLREDVVLKARTLDRRNTYVPWSGLAEASYRVVAWQSSLRITELMYHPVDLDPCDAIGREAYEYVEMKNIGTGPVRVGGMRFTEGIRFTFPDLELASDAYLILTKDPTALSSRGSALRTRTLVLGPYEGQLGNGGERLRCEDGTGRVIHDFEYQDTWCPLTDGRGFSLTVIDPCNTDPADWGLRQTWRTSTTLGGSPGWDDSPVVH